MENILILGAGSWGTALAQTFATNGLNVTLWDASPKLLEEIHSRHTNSIYHPGVALHPTIKVTESLEKSCKQNQVVVVSIPTSFIPRYLEKIFESAEPSPYIVNASKGLNHKNQQTLSMFVKSRLGKIMYNRYAVLSGPSFAKEVIQGKPTAVNLACAHQENLVELSKTFHSDRFQIFPTADVLGVEIGGALKNVIAITVGASDGLGYGNNARAALITKGLEEISSIGKALGAKESTFWGLAGFGDLILTCTGDLSRNRQAGLKLAEGKDIKTILFEIGQIAEGLRTTKSAYLMTQTLRLKCPILEETYKAIYQRKPVKQAVQAILDHI